MLLLYSQLSPLRANGDKENCLQAENLSRRPLTVKSSGDPEQGQGQNMKRGLAVYFDYVILCFFSIV